MQGVSIMLICTTCIIFLLIIIIGLKLGIIQAI